ncbi:MAG: XylR N-terminal domain-containing protein [Caulobacteraceae bacterium]|nr:XylR N-terminal domain-containing protein [Caulobacteraceae bacterium]
MRASEEQEAYLERGGRPTLRELRRDLVFNPNGGAIQLNGERLILQRASHTGRLRDHLLERYGRDETFVALTRLGFQMGMEDADFVRQSWPGLDPGDVFTAGTRLHMLCGCVRLRTIHNDFDLQKGRFSGEFIWQGSVEAVEYRRNHGVSPEPACWSQAGYASGYASQCFGRLIVYKELECLACGHEVCRVLGKPAERWGEDDDLVALYRQEVVPSDLGNGAVARPAAHSERLDPVASLLLSRTRAAIERAARFDTPLLVTGELGTGKRLAARFWGEARFGGDGPLDMVACDALGPEGLDALLDRPMTPTRGRRAKRSQRRIVLTDVDRLTPLLQRRLARRLDEGDTRIAATTRRSAPELSACPDFDQGLLHRLATSTIVVPPLRERREDIPALAEMLLDAAARRHGVKKPALTDEALAALKHMELRGNVTELGAIVQGALIAALGDCIDETAIRGIAARFCSPQAPALTPIEASQVDSLNSLSLSALNERMYRDAMTRCSGNVSAAARSLGMTRAQLAYRLRRRA